MNKMFERYRYCIMKISPRLTQNDIKEIKEITDWDLLITLKNGEQYIYELDSNYHRVAVYENIKKVTEEQERKRFGYALNKLMDRNFITQEELAERTGISQTMISHYITGRYIPNYITVVKIAKALNCSMDDFRHGEYNKYLEDKV